MLVQVVPALGSVRVRTTGVAEDASVRFHGFPSLVNGLAKSHGHRIFVDQVDSSPALGTLFAAHWRRAQAMPCTADLQEEL